MRRLVARLIAAMPLDPFARRALAETLADWKHQDSTASSAARRPFEALRGLAAVSGAMARLTMREVGSADAWVSVGKIVALGALLSLVIAIPRALTRPGWPSVFAEPLFIGHLGLLMLPGVMVQGVALAAIMPPFSRHRSVPLCGTGVLLVVATLAAFQWVVPMTNRAFQAAALERSGKDRPAPWRSPNQWALTEIAERSTREGADGQQAERLLAQRGFVVVLGPVLLWLGASARRFLLTFGVRRGGGILGFATFLAAGFGVGAASPLGQLLLLFAVLPVLLFASLLYGTLAARREQVPSA